LGKAVLQTHKFTKKVGLSSIANTKLTNLSLQCCFSQGIGPGLSSSLAYIGDIGYNWFHQLFLGYDWVSFFALANILIGQNKTKAMGDWH
jgi:hypothetical protein